MEQLSPAPALERGLALLQQLEREGACSLELLAGLSGLPKSSVSRLLLSLERVGVISRDSATKRYVALMHLTPIALTNSLWRKMSLEKMIRLSESSGQTVELYLFERDRLTMIERCEPTDVVVKVHAKIGWERPLDEIDALSQIVYSFSDLVLPGTEFWYWKDGKKKNMPRSEIKVLLRDVQKNAGAVDIHVNSHGVRRYAVPLVDRFGKLQAVLAIAQAPLPGRFESDISLLHQLQQMRSEIEPLVASHI
jgi:DNA-binding IclR family transcriptional regulator